MSSIPSKRVGSIPQTPPLGRSLWKSPSASRTNVASRCREIGCCPAGRALAHRLLGAASGRLPRAARVNVDVAKIGRKEIAMIWTTPTFVEVKMDAEIGSYTEDGEPVRESSLEHDPAPHDA